MSSVSSCVTFVTVYMNIYPKSEQGERDMAWRFQQFAKIAETGIQLCVYVDESSEELLEQFIVLYPNIRKMRTWKTIQDTWTYDICRPHLSMLKLPTHRNETKDTFEYMALMHTKMECMADAIRENPFESTHFAWIDFNIAHIFKHLVSSQSQLKSISMNQWSQSFLVMPGCWTELPEILEPPYVHTMLNTIHWRFCGGFFMGDITSVSKFCSLYQTHFPLFIAEHKSMIWEVNYWTWMEHQFADWSVTNYKRDKPTGEVWKPQWYSADHNDSILHIPMDYWSMCLADKIQSYTCISLEMPFLETDFFPMSSSVTPCSDNIDDGYWMNTRYVNYRLADNGSYIFYHPDKIIVTKNLCTRLNTDMKMTEHFFMANPKDLTSRECNFDGMEDIRIWYKENEKKIYYVGSSVNYAPHKRTRIVTGEYNITQRQLCNNVVVEPPSDTWCEKNWCPIVESSLTNPQKFLYQCSDMTICHIASGKLVIEQQQSDTSSWSNVQWSSTNFQVWLSSCRGSTYFRESLVHPGYWVGLVHYSRNEWPRHYYHVLVLLEPKTWSEGQSPSTTNSKRIWSPVKFSQPFSFCKPTNIEFCIGLMETGDKYHFWVSQYDRDPMRITVNVCDLPFL